jgi:predicted HTH domain antitoxin
MSLTLEIPDEVSKAMHLSPSEAEARLRLELAVSLYAQEILSLGKAAEFAGVSRKELNETLAKRKVLMHYTKEDLADDVVYASRRQ